jgi:hypothetical protein
MSSDIDAVREVLPPNVVSSPINGVDFHIPAKNAYFIVINKKAILKADIAKFNEVIKLHHPSLLMVINIQDVALDIKPIVSDDISGVRIILSLNNFTDDFVRYINGLPSLNNVEMKLVTQLNAKSNAPVAQKISFIEQFEDTEEDFTKYCNQVVKSKVEFERAKTKWPTQMKVFAKKESFIAYVAALKAPAEDAKTNKTSTIEEFQTYLVATPIGKITKKEIKERFSGLSDAITHVDLKGDAFRGKIIKMKEELTPEE